MFNYYNRVDWALNKWAFNTMRKPDNWPPYLFGYLGSLNNYAFGGDIFFYTTAGASTVVLNPAIDRDRYMIFAYCAESRVAALGQVATTQFQNWDLNAAVLYDDQHYSHSREFRSNVVKETPFWEKVVDDCQFTCTWAPP
jgi:hypothetical protein